MLKIIVATSSLIDRVRADAKTLTVAISMIIDVPKTAIRDRINNMASTRTLAFSFPSSTTYNPKKRL